VRGHSARWLVAPLTLQTMYTLTTMCHHSPGTRDIQTVKPPPKYPSFKLPAKGLSKHSFTPPYPKAIISSNLHSLQSHFRCRVFARCNIRLCFSLFILVSRFSSLGGNIRFAIFIILRNPVYSAHVRPDFCG